MAVQAAPMTSNGMAPLSCAIAPVRSRIRPPANAQPMLAR